MTQAESTKPTRAPRDRGQPPRRIVPRGEREEQMLAVATELFAARGFARVSMDEIAERVGITKPMLYAYFDSKQGLFAACVARAALPLEEAVRASRNPADDPERQLWLGLLAFFGFVDDHRSLWRTFFVEGAAHGDLAATAVARVRQAMIDVLLGHLTLTATELGISPELESELAIQAHALMGATESLAAWWVEHPHQAGRDDLALRLMNFAWMGFGDLLSGNFWLPPVAGKETA